MKKILIIVESVFFALLLLGCTEVLIPGGTSDEALSGGTKGPTELYCWYHGEQIPLTLNQDYVNILLDTTVVLRQQEIRFGTRRIITLEMIRVWI